MSARSHLALLLATIVLGGCTHALHLNHTSDYSLDAPLSAHRVIVSTGEQFTFMGFVGNTDYVDETFDGLKKKCPKGKVTGIQTRYSTRLGFLSWTNVLHMTAYCSR